MNSILSAKERTQRRQPVQEKQEIVPTIIKNNEYTISELPNYLRNTGLKHVKDYNHKFILEFGHDVWQQIETKNHEEMKKKIKILKDKMTRKLEENKKEMIFNLKIQMKKENEEIRKKLENKANISMQMKISKLTDDMLIKNELALKEQKEIMNKALRKAIEDLNLNLEEKCKNRIYDALTEERAKYADIIAKEKKIFDSEKNKLINRAQSEEKRKLFDLSYEMKEKFNKEVDKTCLQWKEKCENEVSSVKLNLTHQIHILEERLFSVQKSLSKTEEELKASIIEKEELKDMIINIDRKYEHFINSTLNLCESDKCCLVPTPKVILDIEAHQKIKINLK